MAKRVKRRRPQKKSRCRFCQDGVKHIDHKDTDTLRKLTTSRGKLLSRKRSGNCAKCQRKVRVAIKRARFLGLLSYVGQ